MKVVIMRGIPGAGKSTYIAKHFPGACVCSADHYFLQENGEYLFDPSLLGKAHAQCMMGYLHALHSGRADVVVVDNTNCNAVEYAPYAAVAAAYGIEFEIITLVVSLETSSRNIHGVPEKTRRRGIVNLNKGTSDMPGWWKNTMVTEF